MTGLADRAVSDTVRAQGVRTCPEALAGHDGTVDGSGADVVLEGFAGEIQEVPRDMLEGVQSGGKLGDCVAVEGDVVFEEEHRFVGEVVRRMLPRPFVREVAADLASVMERLRKRSR